MSEKLKPCPFCGKSQPFLGEPENPDEYGVMCNGCGAQGGLGEDGEFAISLLNSRPREDLLDKRIIELEGHLNGVMSVLAEIVLEARTQDPFGDADGQALLCGARKLLGENVE